MKIVLVKSAEPDYTWEKYYTPDEFEKAQAEWDGLPVSTVQITPLKAEGYRVWTAASPHAQQTARAWLRSGNGDGMPYETTEYLEEIPAVSFTDSHEKIRLQKYFRQAKRQWKQEDRRQPESRTESERKADEWLDRLEKDGQDVILISYERRIGVLLKALQKRKYQIRRGSVFHMEPMERILAAKQILTCGRCAHNCQLTHPGCSIGAEKARRAKINPQN